MNALGSFSLPDPGHLASPAAEQKVFPHPPVVRLLAMAGIVLCAGACLFSLLLPWLEPEGNHWLLVLMCLAVFGGCLYVGVAVVRKSHDTVEVAGDGLYQHSPNGPSLFLPWNEIADVQAQNVMQRLVVADASGTRRIFIEYHLQGFGELRRLVLEKATRRKVDPA
ncbi:MAG: hypothetical protein ABR538_10430 [Candidatus Binatia bacterium]